MKGTENLFLKSEKTDRASGKNLTGSKKKIWYKAKCAEAA
jgi:hypothetical protein